MSEEKKEKFKKKHQAENPLVGWIADTFDSCKAFIRDPYKSDRLLSPANKLIERSEKMSEKRAQEREQLDAERAAARAEREKKKELDMRERGDSEYSTAGIILMLTAIVLMFGLLTAGGVALIRAIYTPKAPIASGSDMFTESVINDLATVDAQSPEQDGTGTSSSHSGEDEKYADIEDTQAVLYEEASKAQEQDAAQGDQNAQNAQNTDVQQGAQSADKPPVAQQSDAQATDTHKPVYFVERGKVYDLSDVKHGHRFADMEHQMLIDVSSNQGHISWDKVANAGVEYALIRVGYRGRNSGKVYEDPCYQYNLREAIRVGIKVGVYFYSQAITVEEGKEEAKFILDRIGRYDISMPVSIDYEYESMSVYGELNGRLYEAKLSVDAATNIAMAFCRDVEARGYKPMVYANKDMLLNSLDSYKISGKYKIWLACYTKRATYGDEYNFWQFTDSGHVDGINGHVCLDYWYHE